VSTVGLTVLAVGGCAAAGGFAALAWMLHREGVTRSAARVAALAAAIDGEAAPVAAHGSVLHRRWLVTVAAAVPGVLVVVALLSARGPETSPAPPAVRQPESLELLDMRHTRTSGTLTVMGTVRIRRHDTTAAPSVVTAVVTAFDTGGRVVASGHALLDDAGLDLDGESSFKVAVPAAHALNRYQVRFETPRGTLPHIDRRPDHAAPIPLPSDDEGPEQP